MDEVLLGAIKEILPPWAFLFFLFFVALTAWHWHLLRPDELRQLAEPHAPDAPPTNAEKIRASLLNNSFGETYRRRVRDALAWTGARLPPLAPPERKPGGIGRQFDYAFSNNALGFCLLIAVAYPLLFMMGEYAFFGGGGKIGAVELFDPALTRPRRIMGFLILVFGAGLFAAAYREAPFKNLRRVFSVAARLMLFFAGMLTLTYGAISIAGAGAGAGAGAAAVAVAGAGAGAGAGAVAFAFAGAVAGATAFAGVGGLAIAGAVALAVAGGGGGGGAVAVAVAVAVAGAVAFAGALLILFQTLASGQVKSARAFPLRFLNRRRLAFPLLIGSAVISILCFSRFLSLSEEAGGLFLFLIILPLCNGVFDYFSFGVTRLLLWRATKPPKRMSPLRAGARIALYSLADFLVAALLLIGLAFAIILFMHALNLAMIAGPAGAPLIDIGDKLAALRDPDDTPEWVYLMHFSTFLPSLVHLTLVAASLPITLVPGGWNRKFAEQITPDLAHNDRRRLKIAAWQSLRWTCAAFSVFALFYLFVAADARKGAMNSLGYAGEFFYGCAEWFARAIGAM